MIIVDNLGLANVAHLGSACASHLVATFHFEELKRKKVSREVGL